MDSHFEKFLQRDLTGRSWPQLSAYWLNYIDLPEGPGTFSDGLVDDNYHVREAILKLHNESPPTNQHQFIDASGLRKVQFMSALNLIHKSINLFETAEQDISRGFFTSATINSYHSSFQGVRCINHLLGIALLEIPDAHKKLKPALLDTFTSRNFPKRKEADPKFRSSEIKAEVIKSNQSLSQKNSWMVFQRLLRTTQGIPYRKEELKILTQIPHTFFSAQRNRVFYWDNCWLFEDLHESLVGSHPSLSLDDLQFDPRKEVANDSTFTVIINIIILKLARELIHTIAAKSTAVNQELELIDKKLNSGYYPSYAHESFG